MVRRSVAAAFFIAQAVVFGLLLAHRRPVAHLSPITGATSYRVFVQAGGQNLAPTEIQRRYHLAPSGETTLSTEGLRDVIRQFEQRAGAPAGVYVRLHTRERGRAEEIWMWPES